MSSVLISARFGGHDQAAAAERLGAKGWWRDSEANMGRGVTMKAGRDAPLQASVTIFDKVATATGLRSPGDLATLEDILQRRGDIYYVKGPLGERGPSVRRVDLLRFVRSFAATWPGESAVLVTRPQPAVVLDVCEGRWNASSSKIVRARIFGTGRVMIMNATSLVAYEQALDIATAMTGQFFFADNEK